MTRPILYHCPDARSLRCLWAAEEAEIDVDLKLLKFPPRAFEPDYRAVNPLMTIPGWAQAGGRAAMLTRGRCVILIARTSHHRVTRCDRSIAQRG